MLKKIFIAALMASPLLAALPADGEAQSGDIVAVAQAAGGFETLLAAATAADLVSVLQSEGPFTVFAPTDEAFARIPEAQLEALLQDKEALKRVLLYHVVPGRVAASQVVTMSAAETVAGPSLSVRVVDGSVKIDDSNVVATDIAASNGVIHVIDQVMMPAM